MKKVCSEDGFGVELVEQALGHGDALGGAGHDDGIGAVIGNGVHAKIGAAFVLGDTWPGVIMAREERAGPTASASAVGRRHHPRRAPPPPPPPPPPPWCPGRRAGQRRC